MSRHILISPKTYISFQKCDISFFQRCDFFIMFFVWVISGIDWSHGRSNVKKRSEELALEPEVKWLSKGRIYHSSGNRGRRRGLLLLSTWILSNKKVSFFISESLSMLFYAVFSTKGIKVVRITFNKKKDSIKDFNSYSFILRFRISEQVSKLYSVLSIISYNGASS